MEGWTLLSIWSLSSRRKIFPDDDFGMEDRNSTRRTCLYVATCKHQTKSLTRCHISTHLFSIYPLAFCFEHVFPSGWIKSSRGESLTFCINFGFWVPWKQWSAWFLELKEVHQFVREPHRLLEFRLLLHLEVCFPKLSSPQSVNAFFHDDGCKQDGLWNKLLRNLKNLLLLLLLQVEIH